MHTATSAHGTAGILSPHTSRRPLYFAASVACVIIAITIVTRPLGARMGPVLPAVVSMYAINMSLVQALTAYFLIIQFRSTGVLLLGGVAGAFGFVSVLVFSQMLVFPGVFRAAGLFTGNPQSSIWIWAVWHAGFPLFVLSALLMSGQDIGLSGKQKLYFGQAYIVGGPILAIVVSYVTIAHGARLPVLITNGSYAAMRHSPVMAVIIGGNAITLIFCIWRTRLENLLSLWLAIALLASLADAALTLSGAVRFDLGWYAGRLLSIVSSAVVFCVMIGEISRLYDRLLASNAELALRAARDGLTGAFNRGYFDEQLAREVARALRDRTKLSLLLIDVDYFKQYNDTFGHQRGDECLITIVRALQNTVKRPADFVARYGGEEFVMVLPSTGGHGAFNMAAQSHANIARLRLPRGDPPGGTVSVSIGVATLDGSGGNLSAGELLRRADIALYRAKQDGRNAIRTFAAISPMASQPPADTAMAFYGGRDRD